MDRVELVADAPVEPLTETELLGVGEKLLPGGAQLAVVGYRRCATIRLRDMWPAGQVLPGLITIRADRFPTLPAEEFRSLVPNAVALDQPQGWVLAFPAPPGLWREGSRELHGRWDSVLGLMAAHDVLARAQGEQQTPRP